MTSKLVALNRYWKADAETEFLRCCRSKRWAEGMAAARPFDTDAALYSASDKIWASLGKEDWLEAFKGHPKIGQTPTPTKETRSTASWAREEQAGTRTSSEAVLKDLAAGNETYEKKFGFVFLVCATGKSGDEMLKILNDRLGNTVEAELEIAAKEQAKITRLRLEKLLGT